MTADPLQLISITLAVAERDLRGELRTRFGITALGLFVVTTVSLIVFALAEEPLQRPVAAAIIWVIMFYTAMTGLARAFISEEERGTALFLRLNAPGLAVYFGKLVVNVVMSLLANILATSLVLLFISSIVVGDWLVLSCTVAIGSIGLAAVLSIISAIVAKAGTRNPILPALSFPLLVPLLMPGVNALLAGLAGLTLREASGDLLLMTSYTGLVIIASVFVFDFIWQE